MFKTIKVLLIVIAAFFLGKAMAGTIVHDTYTVDANTYSGFDLSGIDSENDWIALKVVFHETKDDLNKDLEIRARAWSKTTVLSDEISLMKFSGARHCILHIVRPTGWNDKQVMVDAGHEILHCLGASH